MRKLFFKIFILVLPFAIYPILIELYTRTQSTFCIKKSFLEKNLNEINTLILGSSHSQNGINPAFLDKKTSNLAMGGQPMSIDYYLLDKYIDKMPHLTTVFLEITTFRFYNDLNLSDWNTHIYSILYNINYKVEPFSLKNYLFVYSDYPYFSKIFLTYCNPYSYKYKKNEFGFVTNDFNDKFEELKFDSVKINKTFVMGNIFDNQNLFSINESFLIKSIKRCVDKGIRVVLISPPVYKTYFNHIPANKKKEVDSLVCNIVNEYRLKYYDYSCDSRFNIYDFKNDSHLNSAGAEKLSKIINQDIK